jgi:exodeoxyribonuclease VII large subunit
MQNSILDKQILTVSELNRSVKKWLETHFKTLWIEGEVSNLSRPQSGHLYFTLKDAQAQVQCAMFRTRNSSLPFTLENGKCILASAKITLYERRGDYQLIIEHIEERGEGLLRRRFELLKKKLAAEGLFDLAHKKKVPHFPKCIGVVTSPTGAAIKDVLSVLKRRFANIPIIIYPTSVQGQQAAQQIVNAISLSNSRQECDVLIICRGGGSLEDLFAFNEEIVARAIYKSKIPTVSAIGHEVDYTIADFVADQRAPTPSSAAELLSPNKIEYDQKITDNASRLTRVILTLIAYRKMLVENFHRRFFQPNYLLQQYIQTLDILQQSLHKAFFLKLELGKRKLQVVVIKLNHLDPTERLKQNNIRLSDRLKMLNQLILARINASRQSLLSITRALTTVSPLNTLERGYSIVTKESHVIDDIGMIIAGDAIQVEIKNGLLFCIVRKCVPK